MYFDSFFSLILSNLTLILGNLNKVLA